jgi:hypothetical protein
MCVVIVACNLVVICVMCFMSRKNIARQESNLNNAAVQYHNSVSIKRQGSNPPFNRGDSTNSRFYNKTN